MSLPAGLRTRRVGGSGLVALAAMAALAVPTRSARPGNSQAEATRPGVALPIAVKDGVARFVVPSSRTGSRTLVVVSALTRTPGKYPVRVACRPADHPEPPSLADDGPGRPTREIEPRKVVTPPLAAREPPRWRVFHLPVRDGDPSSPSNYAAIRGQLKAVGRHVQIYVDAADSNRVGEATIREAVTTFDDAVYPRAVATVGPAEDVDGDGRFTILFSGWLAHLSGGSLAVDGFVRGVDFEHDGPPIGNRCDMMALNSTLGAGPHLKTVIAHEYRHAITYCRKALGPAGADEEGWLDEALAHLAEDEHGFSRSNLDYRVDAFLAAPERYRLLVDDYSSADLIRSHGHRGSAYLFLRWCSDSHGPGLSEALIRSDQRGVPNLESAAGRSFAALYRDWSVGLFLDAIRPDRSREDRLPPRAVALGMGHEDAAVLDGTTSHYVVVEGSTTGAVAIDVSGPPEARLQVTAVPLPDDYPALDLDARLDGSRMTVTLRGPDARRIRIELLRCSPMSPPSDPAERAAQGWEEDGDRLAGLLGGSTLTGRERLVSRPIPLAPADGCRVVTAVGRDDRGRRVVARATLGCDPRSDP